MQNGVLQQNQTVRLIIHRSIVKIYVKVTKFFFVARFLYYGKLMVNWGKEINNKVIYQIHVHTKNAMHGHRISVIAKPGNASAEVIHLVSDQHHYVTIP